MLSFFVYIFVTFGVILYIYQLIIIIYYKLSRLFLKEDFAQ